MGIFRKTDSSLERRVTYLVSTPYRQPDDPSELPAGATGWGVVPYPGVDPLKTVHDLFGMIEGYDPGARVVGAHMSSAGAAATDELVRLEYIARADERRFTLIPPDCYPETTRQWVCHIRSCRQPLVHNQTPLNGLSCHLARYCAMNYQ